MQVIRLAYVLSVLALTARPIIGQETTAKDADGYPLPSGAFARLGSVRWRVPGPVSGARFVDGGKKLLVHVRTGATDSGGGAFQLLHAQSGMPIARLPFDRFERFEYLSAVFRSYNSAVTEHFVISNWSVSPDGSMLADIYRFPWSNKLHIRELASGKEVIEIVGSGLKFTFVQFSPDNTRIAAIVINSELKDKPNLSPMSIRMWHLPSGKEVRSFVPPPHADPADTFQPHWFTFSPDGTYLAAVGYEDGKSGVTRVWPVAAGRPSIQLEGFIKERDYTSAIAFSPDSKMIAVASDGKIRLLDPATGKRIKDIADYPERCATLEFSTNGKLLLVGAGRDAPNPGRLRMWELASGREIDLPDLSAWAYVFSDDGMRLIMIDDRGHKVVICDTRTGRTIRTIRANIQDFFMEDLERRFYKARQGIGWPICVAPDSKMLVICEGPGQIRRFDLMTGQEIPAPGLKTTLTTALAFAPDGKTLLAAGAGRTLVYHLDGKTPPQEPSPTPAPEDDAIRAMPDAACLAISPDGSQAAVGWQDGSLMFWDTKSGKQLSQTFRPHGIIGSLSFTHDGLIVCTGADGQLTQWRMATGQRKTLFALDDEHYTQPWTAPFWIGPQLTSALVRIDLERLREFELATGKPRREIQTMHTPLAFSADGRFLLLAGPAAFSLMDWATGEEVRSFGFATASDSVVGLPNCAQFSPEARMIVAVAGRNVVRIWDRDTGTLLATFGGHDGRAEAVAFSPDGKTLATSARDGTLLLWKTPPNPVTPAQLAPKRPPQSQVTIKRKETDERLPPAAKQRIGSPRLQNGANVATLRYTAGGKSILAQTIYFDHIDGSRRIDLALWESVTGKLQHTMEATREYSGLIMPVPYWSLSDQGQYLAASNNNFEIKQIDTGQVIFRAEPSETISGNFCFSPDGKSGVDLDTLTVIDFVRGQQQRLFFEGERGQVRHGALSPNAKLLLLVFLDGKIEVMHLEQNPKSLFITGQSRYSRVLPVFSPDSKHIAVVDVGDNGKKPRLKLVRANSGKVAHDLGGLSEEPDEVLFSPDSTQVLALISELSAGWEVKDGKQRWDSGRSVVRRWDVATGKEQPPFKTGYGTAAQFTPDGKVLAIGTPKYLFLHDANNGRELHRFPLELAYAVDMPYFAYGGKRIGVPFAFSPDSKTVAVAAIRAIRQFDMATGKEIGPTPDWRTVNDLAVAGKGQWIATCAANRIQVWDAAKSKVVFSYEPWVDPSAPNVYFTCIALTANGKYLAAGGTDGSVSLFDVPSAKQLRQFQLHHSPVTSLVFGSDDSSLVSADTAGELGFWDVPSGILRRSRKLPGLSKQDTSEIMGDHLTYPTFTDQDPLEYYWLNRPRLAAGGQSIAVLGESAVSHFWFATSQERTMSTEDQDAVGFAVSADGRRIAVHQGRAPRQGESLVRLLDAARTKEERALSWRFPISACCFSPDGKLFAACGDYGFQLWGTATGTPLASNNGHRGGISTLAFSPDGGTLVSAGLDGTLLVWDVAALLGKPAVPELTEAELNALWERLASSDASAASLAMRQLTTQPARAIPFLASRLKPVPLPKADMSMLVADLDDKNPKVRARSTSELQVLGELADPALRACLADTPTLEQRMRAQQLLAHLSEPLVAGDKLRALRAVEILEIMRTAEAVQVLQTLATGAELASVTRAARGAVSRMRLD